MCGPDKESLTKVDFLERLGHIQRICTWTFHVDQKTPNYYGFRIQGLCRMMPWDRRKILQLLLMLFLNQRPRKDFSSSVFNVRVGLGAWAHAGV